MRNDKILSQTEIEALLAGEALLGGRDDDLDAAEEELKADPAEVMLGLPTPMPVLASQNRPAKLYDFRRPDKFSKEHLRSLRILHESFARMLGSSLTSYLSAGVQVRLTMLEQGTYDEYIQSLPTPTVIYVVGLAPLPGQAVVELNLPVARVLIDRLLGELAEFMGSMPQHDDMTLVAMRIEDRGSRIEDRGSRIEDRG